MPTFNILLAHDITHYGSVSVEGDTWEDAVRTLGDHHWLDNCTDASDDGWEQRVVDVETEDGDIVADGINYNCALVHCFPIIHRLTTILDTCDLSDEAATALTDYIQELQAMVQDPIFNKESN
jgi:hypothetical protein